jgi:hypothetical protein
MVAVLLRSAQEVFLLTRLPIRLHSAALVPRLLVLSNGEGQFSEGVPEKRPFRGNK